MFSCTIKELREKWSNLVFARVKKVVVRANDLSIWYNRSGTTVSGGSAPFSERVYFGDNKAILDQFSDHERRNITFEYDYFFGFCQLVHNGTHRNSTTFGVAHQRSTAAS